MRDCPYCLGAGSLDFRDDDAFFSEHFVPAPPKLGIVECDECEGTGMVDDETYADVMAASRAWVDQAMAKFAAQGLFDA